MGNSFTQPAIESPPTTKPIQVRTRFNTPAPTLALDAPSAPSWRSVAYSPIVAAHGHAMCCVDNKVVMVGGTRKYPAVNYAVIDLSASAEVKPCTSVPFKGAPVDWSGLTATLVGG